VIEEFEYKLAVGDPALLAAIPGDPDLAAIAEPGSRRDLLLDTVYYDTADHALREAGLTYRIRQDGSVRTATVKGGGRTDDDGAHVRPEWSSDAPYGLPWPEGAPKDGLPGGFDPAALRPLFRTTIRRTVLLLRAPSGLIEFASDRCAVEAPDGRSAEFCEIELELKGADPADAARLSALLSRRYGLRPEPRSKFARGLELTR
jgi:inorganic triphosphatase YgiF